MTRENATANEILMTDTVTLRPMTVADLGVVSHLGISSKASWGHASQLMEIFAKELTLEASALEQLSTAQVACQNGQILGYFTIREHADGILELEHLFVHPEHFGRGIGQDLLEAALTSATAAGAEKLTVIADPDSAGFYERFGATRVGEHQSSIAGRVIPIYEFQLESSLSSSNNPNGDFDARLTELGLILPEIGPPSGSYVHAVKDGGMLYVAGKGIDGVQGKLGREFTIEQGTRFARDTGLLLLSVIRQELGSLNRVGRIVRVFGMVNCTADFSNHPEVINGCSDLLIDVFGGAGKHVRMAVGANSLPYQTPVEIELSLRIAGARQTPSQGEDRR